VQRLELTWIGKDEEPRLEPRILLEKPELRYGHPDPKNHDWQGMLIHGDNLLALKALEQEYAGKVKCVYIDPPYNTGSAFEHYDDGVEHSIWLSLIRDRLKLLRELLCEEGSIWISIDDHEGHYLKVLCDEIFGRRNFISTVVWEKKYAPKSDSKYLSESHDFILVYCKKLESFKVNRLPKGEKQNARYINKDNDPRGPWKPDNVLRNEAREYAIFPVKLPSGREVLPPAGTSWRYTKEKFDELIRDNRIWFGIDGNARPAYKRFLSEVSDTIPATTLWKFDEVGHNDEAKKEVKIANSEDIFATPKPERLIQRIIHLATNPGDLVLDSFLGSGTTAAVAHKMGRRWIGIELGEHAYTHCVPRLQKVIKGEDQGGVSKVLNWQGGGGMRVFTLAPTLILEDRFGQPIINPQYQAAMLAAAVCKHEGYHYQPHPDQWWKQGQGAEKDYILTTTQYVNRPFLDAIQAEMQETESLLICCKAYDQACEMLWPNITMRKIPSLLAQRCEYGRDDYSFNIVSVPNNEEPEDLEWVEPLSSQTPPPNQIPKQGELF
jgi:adenine-specific DNA-methyltransferase